MNSYNYLKHCSITTIIVNCSTTIVLTSKHYLPVITISEAPHALAVNIHTRPIGPAPHTRTLLPRPTPARWHACTPTLSGSNKAPSSNETLSGNLIKK